MHFRFNSTLPQSLQHRKHHCPRKYARLQLTAAAAVAVGALGATAVSAGTAALSASAAVHGASAGRSNAAAGNSAQHRAHAQPAAASAAGARVQAAHTDAERRRAAHANAARSAAAQARQAKARAARSQQAQAQAAPAAPYLIYDSVSPSAIPVNQQRVATYANGAYAAGATAVAGRGSVLWIDTNGSDPAASALDVEPGDATPAGAAQWVDQKLTGDPHSLAIVYTMLSDWQQVKDDVAGLPAWMQSRVRYWIADPTGVPHMVAGSDATQWYWGNSYDITTANPNFQAP